MARFAQGKFELKHPQKYVGRKTPTYRSSWEFAFMKFCDENPAIQAWASEAVKIPYRNPLTGKATIYVPDFFIQYKDKKGRARVELIEIKPSSQAMRENIGKNKETVRKNKGRIGGRHKNIENFEKNSGGEAPKGGPTPLCIILVFRLFILFPDFSFIFHCFLFFMFFCNCLICS